MERHLSAPNTRLLAGVPHALPPFRHLRRQESELPDGRGRVGHRPERGKLLPGVRSPDLAEQRALVGQVHHRTAAIVPLAGSHPQAECSSDDRQHVVRSCDCVGLIVLQLESLGNGLDYLESMLV